MATTSSFQTQQILASVRFIQGYRYLDRCGEALVKLENTLSDGWIPSEPSPKSGSLKNDQLGMTATFNSEALTVHQAEFISFEHFLDQTCKIFEVLRQTFEIKRINVPALKVTAQRGFDDDGLEEASRALVDLRFCIPNAALCELMGGNVSATDFVLVTDDNQVWNDERVIRRRRFQSQVVRQERQPPFDERLLRRSRQLGSRQHEAITALMQLRRHHPAIAPVAIQVEMEDSFDNEFAAESFDLPALLEQGWAWAETVRGKIGRLEGGKG